MAATFKAASSQYLTVAYNAVMGFTTGLTVCGWVNPSSATGTYRLCGRNVSATGNTGTEVFGLEVNAGAVRLLIGKTTLSGVQVLYSTDTASGGTVPANKWTHIAGTFDGSLSSANLKVYVNGVVATSATRTGSMLSDTSNPLSIGATYQTLATQSTYFDGSMEDIRLYNRAMTANELLTLYATRGSDGIHYGNVLNIGMYEGSRGITVAAGSTVKDVGPYGLNATSVVSGVTFIETYIKNRRSA